MKIQVLIHKTVEVDTDEEWGGDLALLYEKLRGMGLSGTASAPQLNHAIGEMIDEDISTIGGEETFTLGADDIQVSVPDGTVLEIPEDESDEPEKEDEYKKTVAAEDEAVEIPPSRNR